MTDPGLSEEMLAEDPLLVRVDRDETSKPSATILLVPADQEGSGTSRVHA